MNNKKKKILFIDQNNNTPQLNYPLIYSLQNYFDITYCTSFNRFGTKYYDDYAIKKLYIFFRFENKISNRNLRKIVKSIFYPFYYIQVVFYILKEQFNIIHFNWLPIPVIDYFFIKLLKLFKMKIILTTHNYSQHNNKKLRFFENNTFKIFDKIICLTEFVKNQFNEDIRKNITVIEHGNSYKYELNKYVNLLKKNKNTYFEILFLGSLKPYKGIELLLKAFELIKDDNVRLTIAGYCSDSYLRKLNNLIKELEISEKVFFDIKFLSNLEMFQHISDCNMGILPYLEASQSGLPDMFYSLKKPIILTNVGGLPEQAFPKISLVVEPEIQQLSKGILQMKTLIQNNEITNIMFEEYLKNNSWDRTVQKYKNLYETLTF